MACLLRCWGGAGTRKVNVQVGEEKMRKEQHGQGSAEAY